MAGEWYGWRSYNTAKGELLAFESSQEQAKLGGWKMETKRVPSGSSQRVDRTRKDQVILSASTLSQYQLDTLRAEKAMTSSSLQQLGQTAAWFWLLYDGARTQMRPLLFHLICWLVGLLGETLQLRPCHSQAKAPNSVWLPYQVSVIAFFPSANRIEQHRQAVRSQMSQ